ncbi:condensin-2 complex subunit H2-like [Sycon ciliatum]|uniref:condensin-2 complex subunit H2-like n=1 Tax=Sycon ciliatum TaxID=27933 RepID=UPI0020AE98BB|eukprot:scpid59266/ scgid24349/ Condensin-2 complex subunit H2; Non-SMC condensin II complex subunit H2
MDADGPARFAHLLQPIRDLSQNWEIDIASLLADYLEEIDKIAITFDDGQTTMNFAEAALLIQGSASIYSKKIEYLYSLVYQTLNLLASNKELEQGTSVDEAGNDRDTSFGKNKRKDEEFLALDDIKQGNDIDLAEGEGIDTKPVATLPKPPIALVPLAEVEKRNYALLSRTGELLGSRKDFRMNTCTCHPSGALLMDYADIALVPRALSSPLLPSLGGDETLRHGLPAEGMSFAPGMDDTNVVTEPPPAFVLDDPNELDATFPSPEKGAPIEKPAGRLPRRLNTTSSRPSVSTPVRDPWEVLDPHETPSSQSDKAFRRGRPFRIPGVLSGRGQKSANKKRAHEESGGGSTLDKSSYDQPELMPLLEFCRLAFHSQASRFPSNFLKAPSFADFEELFWAEQKRRRQQLKKERALCREKLSREDEEYAFDDKEYSDDEEAHMVFQPGGQSLGQAAAGVAGLATTSVGVGPADNSGDGDDLGFAGGDDGVFADLGPSQFGGAIGGRVGDGIEPMAIEDGALSQFVVSSYEDLVRQHVDGFITSANQYLKESDLARRVREWEERIKPVLDEEEQHPPYDIHAYGWQVLQTFSDDTHQDQIDFAKVAEGKQQFEVCRLFLASLQLANNRNVDIVCGSSDRNSMQMKLLQTEQIHTRLEQYQAPSLASSKDS